MANLTVRKQNGGQLAPQAAAEWDPYRAIRELMRWDPFREMLPTLGFEAGAAMPFVPAFEVRETRDSYVFKGDVPGVKPQDIEVHVTGNRLTISGKREADREEKSDAYYACERAYGSFTRGFTLPSAGDGEHVRAELRDGVLTVVLPKKPEVQARKIPIQTEKGKS